MTGRLGPLVAALLLPAWASAAGMAISASLDREEVALGELVTLEVRVEAGEAPTLSLPSQGFDFDVVSRGSSRSTSINMGGGSGMKVQHVFSFQFGLRPRRAGDLTVPPVEVVAGEARGETQPLAVKVLPAGSPTTRPPGGGQPGPPVLGFPSLPRPPGAGSGRAWHGWERDLQLSVEVDRTEVFLGEQVTASIWILSPVGVAETGNFKPPAYDGFWTEQLELPKEPVQQLRKKDGLPLRAYLLQRIALFPTRSGPLELGPHTIDLIVRVASSDPFSPFGDLQRVARQSQPVTITVKPLPASAPTGFDQVNVGTATLAASLSSRTAAVGQPITLRLVAEGEGNVKAWSLPPLPAIAGVRAFAPTSSDQLRPRGVKFAGSRTLETVLVPEVAGTLVVPPLRWATFDPKAGAYRELKTAELRLEVAAGAASAAASTAAQNTLFPGLRPVRPADPLARAAAPGIDWPLWAFLLLPVAAFAGLTAADRIREAHLASGGARRVRVAGRVARRRLATASRLSASPDGAPFFSEVERALLGYCADKLGRPATGLTRDELAVALTEAGAHVMALRALASALDACDAGRFGGAVARQELLALAGRAMELLEEAHWTAPGAGR